MNNVVLACSRSPPKHGEGLSMSLNREFGEIPPGSDAVPARSEKRAHGSAFPVAVFCFMRVVAPPSTSLQNFLRIVRNHGGNVQLKGPQS